MLEWTLDALGEVNALERFLAPIPGFYKPDVVKVQDFPLPPHEVFLIEIPLYTSSREACRPIQFPNWPQSTGSPSVLTPVQLMQLGSSLHISLSFRKRCRVPRFIMGIIVSKEIDFDRSGHVLRQPQSYLRLYLALGLGNS